MNFVTGASGFLGKEISDFFNKKGINFRPINKNECKKIKEGKFLKEHQKYNPNAFLHLAALNNDKKKSYKDFYDSNVTLTLALFNYAVSMSCKKFVFFSTINCQREKKTKDFYSKTKSIAEEKLKELALKSNIKLFILRLPPVVDKDTQGNIKFIYNYLKLNFPLFLPNKAKKNKRSIIYIKDIHSLLHMILNDKIKENTYMVTRKNELSTNKLINKIKKEISSKTMIFFIPDLFFYPIKLLFKSTYDSLFEDLVFDESEPGKILHIDD